jgi:hypothetical protein
MAYMCQQAYMLACSLACRERRPRTKTRAGPTAIQTQALPQSTYGSRRTPHASIVLRTNCSGSSATPASMPAHRTGLHGSSGPVAMQYYYSTCKPCANAWVCLSTNLLAGTHWHTSHSESPITSSHVKSIFAGYYIVPLQLICRHHGQYSETHHHGVHHTTGEQHLNKIRAECAQCTAIA